MTEKRLWIYVFVLAFGLGTYGSVGFASPIELTACDNNVGTGSYILGNNITTAGDCFILTGNNITIDLNGFTITGDENGRGIWDGGIARENIVIRNGILKDFVQAVSLGETDGCLVEEITASSGGAGIIAGDHCIVTHNVATGNFAAGILSGRDCTISYNVSNNNNSGISLNLTNVGSSVLHNTTNGNVNVGLNVICPSLLIGNVSQNNGTNLLQQLGSCKRYDNLF